MSDIETTELKLKTTPTGGVSGEHSPYYRRLLSAGYKGYLQGTLGGAGYYGVLGLGIGSIVGLCAAPFTGGLSLWLIPALGGAGVLKGADAFGTIGSTAAINAESADLAEQRRYLLDRYYDLPEGPEGDKQAAVIKQELQNQYKTDQPHQLFHWKTVAVCALIGAALAFTFLSPMGFGLLAGAGPIGHILGAAGLGELTATGVATAHSALFTSGIVAAIGTAVGALAGATIGIDRHYVRSWFDGSEKLLHDEGHAQEALRARAMQVARLKEAAREDKETTHFLERNGQMFPHQFPTSPTLSTVDTTGQLTHTEAPTSAKTASLAHLDTPDSKVSAATLENRLKDVQEALQIPSV